jgi:hypothetical protein
MAKKKAKKKQPDKPVKLGFYLILKGPEPDDHADLAFGPFDSEKEAMTGGVEMAAGHITDGFRVNDRFYLLQIMKKGVIRELLPVVHWSEKTK